VDFHSRNQYKPHTQLDTVSLQSQGSIVKKKLSGHALWQTPSADIELTVERDNERKKKKYNNLRNVSETR
jgi:hypothetical protein